MSCSESTPRAGEPVAVSMDEGPAGYRLLRDGKPYTIRGAGMAIDDIERFARFGGNSIRTWTTENPEQDTRLLLDTAAAHGVTVALGLSMPAGRGGFDYDDEAAVAAEIARVRAEVLKYRNHPALLFWLVGNELNHHYSNPRVFDAVNAVAEMIADLDPHHPVTTPLAGFDPATVATVQARAPALDFLSFQLYGGLFGLRDQIVAAGFEAPFMITEWGTLGYWEMETTAWGAPKELTSTEKAEFVERGWNDVLEPLAGQLLGNYVFIWGQKQERTPTWFGLLTERNHTTAAADRLARLWTGEWPPNRAPSIEVLLLDGRGFRADAVLTAGTGYPVRVDVTDPDGDRLGYRWEVKPESVSTATGGDFEEAIANVPDAIADPGFPGHPGAAATTVTIATPGAYRLFVYVDDGEGHVAHANLPFRVAGFVPQAPEALVAGEVRAVAYSGYREGQHPDRGAGAVDPSPAEVTEDLELLVDADLNLIRLYDAGSNSRSVLETIRREQLPIRVLLGIWLRAEISNHEGCPWLDEPIPDAELAANVLLNDAEIARSIALAREFDDIVVAVNVGNEALVEWNDHMVSLEAVIDYVRRVRDAIPQPVTVADNYEWWIRDGAPLAAEVDFLGVHTYALWEGKTIDAGLDFTIENLAAVQAALPDRPIAILEAGWATRAVEFGERAGEAQQRRYLHELFAWGGANNVSVFFFSAFDEPWKGDPQQPDGAEKHWGLFDVDRRPKRAVADRVSIRRD